MPGSLEVFDQRLVFGQSLVRTVEQHAALARSCPPRSAGVASASRPGHEVFLQVVEMVDGSGSTARRAGRRLWVPGPEMMSGVRASSISTESTSSTMAKWCLRCTRSSGDDGHVVTQVVETEFVVRAEGDVGHVGLAPGVGVGLRVVDAGYRQPVELVHRAHPLRVALGQVVVRP